MSNEDFTYLEALRLDVELIRQKDERLEKDIEFIKKSQENLFEDVRDLQILASNQEQKFSNLKETTSEIKDSVRWANRTFIATIIGIIIQITLLYISLRS